MLTEREQVRTLVGTQASISDEVFDGAWKAADGYVSDRVTWAPTEDQPDTPGQLVQAVVLLTGRYLARRNTPSGVLDVGELGAVRIPGADADVQRLIAPFRPVIFG